MSHSFANLWTVAHQFPLSMEFSRQEYWSGLPFPSPGDLPDPGIKPMSPALAGGFFTTEPLRKPSIKLEEFKCIYCWRGQWTYSWSVNLKNWNLSFSVSGRVNISSFKIGYIKEGFPGGSAGKESACYVGGLGSIPGFGGSPGEGKATHSSIMAWRIPWTV